ncbi:nucleoside triphosphate pyrophosphohydrolase [Marinicella rhabdoformis]|uniref:nucleoside triphosphate pyrophosphohydrolase n=1 Tax=Marinicella rhabdoformis TaxID=2580566 RepID=UPI0012AEC235|nr:nucleoside triphosphate pyrophosphohydrolase [Marinicella rhabdoformis]
MKEINELLDLMANLRNPQTGCPWDIKQNFKTIAPYTIEEAYEVADAIERGVTSDIKNELGDLLFQVVFHARIAEEQGLFNFKDVTKSVTDKMIERHPHVFGNDQMPESDHAQTKKWEADKAKDKESVLDGIAANLPELLKAVKLTKYASVIGFDWPDVHDVLLKLDEEVSELKEAVAIKSKDDMEDELGDVLFVCANIARHLNLDPSSALRRANKKFTQRFQSVEKRAKIQRPLQNVFELSFLDKLWNEVKSKH